jgi:hypothetical protein
MKKITPAFLPLSIICILLLSPTAYSDDDTYEVTVVGRRDNSNLPRLTQRADQGQPLPSGGGGSKKATDEKKRQECLNNAGEAKKKCDSAYATGYRLCNSANFLLTGGATKGILTWSQWKGALGRVRDASDTMKDVNTLLTAASGVTGTVVEYPLQCTDWNSKAVKFCADSAEKIKQACH